LLVVGPDTFEKGSRISVAYHPNGSEIKAMTDSLGILVNTNKYLDYVVNLTRAAHSKGKDVQIFFTGKGVLLTMKPDFKKLVGKAKLAICDISFRSYGLYGREHEVPGVGFKDFATQAKNAEMVALMDRYLVF
jgi:predicted peroxiredoxin